VLVSGNADETVVDAARALLCLYLDSVVMQGVVLGKDYALAETDCLSTMSVRQRDWQPGEARATVVVRGVQQPVSGHDTESEVSKNNPTDLRRRLVESPLDD
jgi:hypothetical protein